jgi:hypothetical protein
LYREGETQVDADGRCIPQFYYEGEGAGFDLYFRDIVAITPYYYEVSFDVAAREDDEGFVIVDSYKNNAGGGTYTYAGYELKAGEFLTITEKIWGWESGFTLWLYVKGTWMLVIFETLPK